jgi:hypothetical protein
MQKQLFFSKLEADVSSLPQGVYCVQITGENGTFTAKFLKE